jgi:hypothetical protein
MIMTVFGGVRARQAPAVRTVPRAPRDPAGG